MPAVKKKKKPKAAPKSRNPVARALRHAKPKVEEKATAYSRKRLKKPAAED
jgi:tRNA(Ile2) C34 agmatinyltransferase TiaS